MRVLPSLLALVHLLSLAVLAQGVVAGAGRKLPANLQVDLLFPRNETYAPTQLFPIVLGIQNLDAIWPFDLFLDLTVLSLDAWQNNSSRGCADWQHVALRLNSVGFPNAVGSAPGRHFLYYPTINMTNGTTDRFAVRWGITLANRCFSNNSGDPLLDDGGEG
ncbi:lysM domain-containing protein [Colletotrichum tofieldiae]|nr:lysM domain-containing protein [Colletotrichum tofieldiae]